MINLVKINKRNWRSTVTNKTTRYNPIPPEILDISNQFANNPEKLLEILSDLKDHPNGLSGENISFIARTLKIPAHHAYGVKTFYSMLSTHPRKNTLRVCDGPVCWLKRATIAGKPADDLLTAYEENLPKEEWVVERSSCLGLCDRSPAILVNDEQAGPISVDEAGDACQGWRGVPTDYSVPRFGETRVMLANIDKMNPDEVESAIKFGAYLGLKAALQSTPDEVISVLEIYSG
jgi:NADH:ubiquinone oxidoreductase subunit E